MFSGDDFSLIHTLESPNETAYSTEFGVSQSVPDLDGDEVDDLFISSFGSRLVEEVFIVSGATGALIDRISSPAPAGSLRFGTAATWVPDQNEDGLADLLIGASGVDSGAFASGRVYLFSGQDRTLLDTYDPAIPKASGRFGTTVARLNDFTGDGIDDFAIGEEGGTEPEVYLYCGATGSFLFDIESPNRRSNSRSFSVRSITDVSGDGIDDILLAGFFEDIDDIDRAGRCYLFTGLPEINVSRTAIGFERVPPGETRQESISVRNTGLVSDLVFENAGAEIIGSNASDFSFATQPDLNPVGPDVLREFTLQFNPVGIGEKSAVLRLTTNDPDESVLDIPLAGRAGDPIEEDAPGLFLSANTSVMAVTLATGERTVASSDTVGSGPSFGDPADIVVENADSLLVLSSNLGRIVRIDRKTGDRTIVSDNEAKGTGPAIAGETALAVDSEGTIILPNTPTINTPTEFLLIDPVTGDRTDFPVNGIVENIIDLEVAPDGKWTASSSSTFFGPTFLYQIDPSTGDVALIENFDIVSARFISGLTFSSEGNILCVGEANDFLLEIIDGTERVLSSDESDLGERIDTPSDVAIDQTGFIYVVQGFQTDQAMILKINPATGARTVISHAQSETGRGTAITGGGTAFANRIYMDFAAPSVSSPVRGIWLIR